MADENEEGNSFPMLMCSTFCDSVTIGTVNDVIK